MSKFYTMLFVRLSWMIAYAASIFISVWGIFWCIGLFYILNFLSLLYVFCFRMVSIRFFDSQLPFLTLLFKLGAMHIEPPLERCGEKFSKSWTWLPWGYTRLKLSHRGYLSLLSYFAGHSYLNSARFIGSLIFCDSPGSRGRSSVYDWNCIAVLFWRQPWVNHSI